MAVAQHSFDTPDAAFGAGFHEVMEQDRIVVEAQDPAELPLDPREELHLKLADSDRSSTGGSCENWLRPPRPDPGRVRGGVPG